MQLNIVIRNGIKRHILNIRSDPTTTKQRHQTGDPATASASSLTRWGIRLEPYRMTGNAERSELVGLDLILLAIVFTFL